MDQILILICLISLLICVCGVPIYCICSNNLKYKGESSDNLIENNY